MQDTPGFWVRLKDGLTCNVAETQPKPLYPELATRQCVDSALMVLGVPVDDPQGQVRPINDGAGW